MTPTPFRPDPSPHFYKIQEALLSVPQPRPGTPAAFGELTSSQKLVVAVIAGLMYGRSRVLSISDGEIAHRLGWDRHVSTAHAVHRVSNALHGRWMRGVWHPGVIANGWVELGGKPKSHARRIAATPLLEKICDLTPNEFGALGSRDHSPELLRDSAHCDRAITVLRSRDQSTVIARSHNMRVLESLESSSSESDTVRDDDDSASLPGDEYPNIPEFPESPELPESAPGSAHGLDCMDASVAAVAPEVPASAPGIDPATVEAVARTVAMIRILFSDDLAASVEEAAPRMLRELRGDWSAVWSAMWTIFDMKRKPERFVPYLRAAARKNAEVGLDPEAARIEAAYHARAAAASAAAAERARRAPPPAEAEAELSREEKIEHWTGLLTSSSATLRDLAKRNLETLTN